MHDREIRDKCARIISRKKFLERYQSQRFLI